VGGARIAADLPTAAGVPVLDFKTLSARAQGLLGDVPDLEELEERVGGRFNAILLSVAHFGEAARSPCVILAPIACVALRDHPGAIHVRLRAPLEWRIAASQREHVVDRAAAERAVKHDDHAKRMWVKTLYHHDLDDHRPFTIALDVSRFGPDRVVEILLASAGAAARL
jgi:Cytidylate kinase-like family